MAALFAGAPSVVVRAQSSQAQTFNRGGNPPAPHKALVDSICQSDTDFATVAGQGSLCQASRSYVVRLKNGKHVQVAPPDTIAALMRNPTPGATPALRASTAATEAAFLPSQCATSLQQPHIELYYAYFQGEPDNMSWEWGDVMQQFLSVDQNYMSYDAAVYFGVNLHLKVECDTTGNPAVHQIALSTPISQANFSTIVTDMTNAGHCMSRQGGGCTGAGPTHYWVYTDGNPVAAYGYAGQSTVVGDDTAASSNSINSSDAYSVNYGYCLSPAGGSSACDPGIDNQGAGFGPQIFAHEDGHALGAVQLSAPNSTGAWHCTNGTAVMCYDDGGPYGGNYTSRDCGSTPNGTAPFDCDWTDDFNPAPPPGSYLATHWDIASAYDAWITLPPASTSTTLQLSTPYPVAGKPLTLSAVVASSSGAPRGTVSFTDGMTQLGSVPVNASGIASLTTSSLAVGTHQLAAAYAPSGNFAASTAPSLSVVVYQTLPAARYVPVTPFRVFDSRATTCVQCADGGAALGQGASQTIQITGNPSGNGTVPASALAVVVNVTATNGSSGTFLQVTPADSSSLGTTSDLNIGPVSVQANLVIVPLGPGGQVALYNAVGRIDAVIDVEGYFLPQTAPPPSGTAGTFHPMTPLRMCDTRAGSDTACTGAGDIDNPLGAGQWRAVELWSTAPGGVPEDGTAGAVAFNLTSAGGTAATYMSAYPTDPSTHQCGAPPLISNLNVPAATNRPNRVIVPIDPTNGDVCIYNSSGTMDFVIDVNGWFGTGGETTLGALYYSGPPVRVCDTRSSQPSNQCTGKTLGPASVLKRVAISGFVPGTPAPVAIAANLTGTGAIPGTYVTAYPDDVPHPLASDLNVPLASAIPDLTVVSLGSDGGIDLYNSLGIVDLVVDLEGWFA